jgi:4-hydroxythreonine-4-phosphate dehydrogenase
MSLKDNENAPIRIGITCGDLNGIGMEVIFKTLEDNQIADLCTPILFASSKAVGYHRKALDMNSFHFNMIQEANQAAAGKNNLVNVWQELVNLEYGVLSDEVGSYSLKSIDAAIAAFKAGAIDAVVTAPIHKANVKPEENNFKGHTGYLGDAFGQQPLMILSGEHLRVALVTGHLPIKEVADALTKEKVENALRLLQQSLVADFGIPHPRIAVLGLNPHAGDEGLIGREEQEIITPAIEACSGIKAIIKGPYAADGFFGNHSYRGFDGVLAMYHDQGLAPFKALNFGGGVNLTAGLDLIRTSPDHGTGFDIAGKGVANESSFRQALFAAIDVVRNRRVHGEITANPLPYKK